MSDLVKRLQSTRANMIGTDDEQHYFDCHEAADRIERLEAFVERVKAAFEISTMVGTNIAVEDALRELETK